MAQRCATVAELVQLDPSISDYGTQDTGTLTVASAPSPGDTITLLDEHGVLPVQVVLTADTDFAIAGTDEGTATNIATAIEALSITQATAIGSVVYVASVATGEDGKIGTTSSDASMVWSAATLDGGTEGLEDLLAQTCTMINLETWGTKASFGSAYLALHFLEVSGVNGGSETGPVIRKKIDKLETSYRAAVTAQITGNDALFGSTTWGRLYLAMRSTLMVLPMPARRTLLCL